MFPVFGSKPMLNSPEPAFALESSGAASVW